MKLSRILTAATLLLAISLGIGIAHAAGSATNGGTAPNLLQAGVEYIQVFWTNGPTATAPITSTSYTYTAHRICMYNDPVTGACVYANVTPGQAYLCMTTTQTGPANNAPDLRCLDNIQPGTHTTTKFNGININMLSKRPRWYFGFIANGGGALNPIWEGRQDSVTVSW